MAILEEYQDVDRDAEHSICFAAPQSSSVTTPLSSNLNWTKISVDDCKAQGGIVIEKADGKKVAKKL